ncbi:MAG: hypothetical protein J6336_04175, partial [Kiritimatiellae bacterium]|nr:hypothetical protein [Kiritimatiellia bacterium]
GLGVVHAILGELEGHPRMGTRKPPRLNGAAEVVGPNLGVKGLRHQRRGDRKEEAHQSTATRKNILAEVAFT